MSTTTFSPSDPLTWKQADADVHVATRSGEFAGFVEFDGAAFVVRDHHGTDLGAFALQEDAFQALEQAHDAALQHAAAGGSLPRTWRRRPRRARA